jgi:hypothetical protein
VTGCHRVLGVTERTWSTGCDRELDKSRCMPASTTSSPPAHTRTHRRKDGSDFKTLLIYVFFFKKKHAHTEGRMEALRGKTDEREMNLRRQM